MTDHSIGDAFAAATATALAFLGALGAAMKFWKPNPVREPEKGGDMAVLTRRVDDLETAVALLVDQQRRAEADRQEANEVRGQIFEQIRLTRESVARIEGRLAR